MNNFDVPYSRLVFCPHVYGTSVRSDSVGNDDFSVWDSDFGFIKTTNWQLNNIPIIFLFRIFSLIIILLILRMVFLSLINFQ
jgi:hypothetical protein